MNKRAQQIKEAKEKRRQQTLNRTWRNPRFYVALLVLPIALPLSLVVEVVGLIGDCLKWSERHAEDFLRWFWSPLEKWIREGERDRPGTGIAGESQDGSQRARVQPQRALKRRAPGIKRQVTPPAEPQ